MLEKILNIIFNRIINDKNKKYCSIKIILFFHSGKLKKYEYEKNDITLLSEDGIK